MTERDHHPDPRWSDDLHVGEIPLPDGASVVRLSRHHRKDACLRRDVAALVPLIHPTGPRAYVHV